MKKKTNIEDVNKQAYVVMSNINALKFTTNISDKNHKTLMDSFFYLQCMFNEHVKKNGITKIKAKFKGQNNSCGYKTNKDYILTIQHNGQRNITIENEDGSGFCEYESMTAFFNNWDNITKN